MPSLKRVGISFLLVLSWMWIYRLPDGSALAEVKDETGMFSSAAIQQRYPDPRGSPHGHASTPAHATQF